MTESFLLLEFESLRELRASLNSLVAAETNIYVAIVGATFLALAFIGQVLGNDDQADRDKLVLGLAFGALVVVLLLGSAIYSRVVSSRITVVKYARYMNRVRSYFLSRNVGLSQFISSDIYDDMPPFGAVGTSVPILGALMSNTGMIAILNSSALAALVGISCSLIGISNTSLFEVGDLGIQWSVVLIVVAFGLAISIHHAYQVRRYRLEERRWIAFHPMLRQD